MLKLCRVTKLKVFFPVLVHVFKFDLFEFSAAILEKGLLLLACSHTEQRLVLTCLSVVQVPSVRSVCNFAQAL